MRSPLKKLLALVTPVLAALAVMAGPASAAPSGLPTCHGNRDVSPASSIDGATLDKNMDGVICVSVNGHGKNKDDK
jgi:hypothetical protein